MEFAEGLLPKKVTKLCEQNKLPIIHLILQAHKSSYFLTITPFPLNNYVNQFNTTKTLTVKYLTKNEA